MKGKFTTKTVVISVLIAVLLAAGITGTVLFLKDSGEAVAMQEENLVLPVAGNDKIEEEENIQQEEKTDEENETAVIEEADNSSNQTNNQENTTTNNTGNIAENRSQAQQETNNVINIEESVVTKEKQVLDELSLSWTTIKLPPITTDIGVYKPELVLEKT